MREQARRYLGILVVLLCFVSARASAAYSKVDKPWLNSMRLGLSPYTSLAGVEFQYKNVAFTTGFPFAMGLKYYENPYGHSFFIGAFYMHFTEDYDETHSGIYYSKYTLTMSGIGTGYRWLWNRKWGLEVGLAVADSKTEYRGPTYTDTEHETLPMPELVFNYSFQ